MTRPGDQFRSMARRLYGPRTMEHLIDPVIADIQRDHAEAIDAGRLWRGRWIRFSGWWCILKVVCLYALTAWAIGRTALIASTGTALVTVPLVLAPLVKAAAFIQADRIEVSGQLVTYLLPQALVISLPIGFTVGAIWNLRSAVATWRIRPLILATACLCSIVTFLNVGWIAPAANQEFRMVVSGYSVDRGTNELTFSQLRQKVNESGAADEKSQEPLPALFWYHDRLALCAVPILMAGFSFALTASRRRFRWLNAALALSAYLSCYVLFPPEQVAVLLRWLSPIAVAWLPNTFLIIAAASMVTFRAQASSATP